MTVEEVLRLHDHSVSESGAGPDFEDGLMPMPEESPVEDSVYRDDSGRTRRVPSSAGPVLISGCVTILTLLVVGALFVFFLGMSCAHGNLK